MPDWIKWVFDGLGTAIISLIAGGVFGGFVGYRIGKRRSKVVQTQQAGSDSSQFQVGKSSSEADVNTTEKVDMKTVLHQSQKAGDNSKQTQIGG